MVTKEEQTGAVMTPEEVAKYLKLGRSSCYEALRRGDIPSIRIGHRFLIPVVALERMLSEAKGNAGSQA